MKRLFLVSALAVGLFLGTALTPVQMAAAQSGEASTHQIVGMHVSPMGYFMIKGKPAWRSYSSCDEGDWAVISQRMKFGYDQLFQLAMLAFQQGFEVKVWFTPGCLEARGIRRPVVDTIEVESGLF